VALRSFGSRELGRARGAASRLLTFSHMHMAAPGSHARTQHAVTLLALLVLVGCSGSARERPAQPAPPPQGQYVEFGMTVEEHDGPPGAHDDDVTDPARPTPVIAPSPSPPPPPATADQSRVVKNQPPHIKLKLGHFRNARYNIGVTIDLTEQTENVADIDPAKLRFDGDPRIWRLEGRHGAYGRIDYVPEGKGRGVMLQVQADGHMSIYIPDPSTGRSSDEIHLSRDGDADPL